MDFTSFSKNLDNLLKTRNLSSTAFSEEIGMPTATISRYLSGTREPRITYVVKIADFFGVSVDWLLGISGKQFEVLPQDVQDVIQCYQMASIDDRKVVHAVLNKYMRGN